MKSEWKVSSNIINGKSRYSIYRLLDTKDVDHSGNRETLSKEVIVKIAKALWFDAAVDPDRTFSVAVHFYARNIKESYAQQKEFSCSDLEGIAHMLNSISEVMEGLK